MSKLTMILKSIPTVCLVGGVALPTLVPQTMLSIAASLGLILVGIGGWFALIGAS